MTKLIHKDDEIKFEVNLTDMDCGDFINKIIQTMKVIGYHEVAIWRALKNNAYEMVEYFESVDNSKNEWDN